MVVSIQILSLMFLSLPSLYEINGLLEHPAHTNNQGYSLNFRLKFCSSNMQSELIIPHIQSEQILRTKFTSMESGWAEQRFHLS